MLNKNLFLKNGNILVKLAETQKEILEAQKLRYESLVLDFDDTKEAQGIDVSEYDSFCDHLIAIDELTGEVVGTYRLMSSDHLKYKNAFICEREFDITNLKNCGEGILELGRAVVHKNYRNGIVIKLLWQGLFNYCKLNNLRYMFGTGSFHGTDTNANLQAFSYLNLNYKVKSSLDCFAKEPSVKCDLLSAEEIDEKLAKSEIPSLLKGYLALGSKVGSGAYIDYEFNSTDVMIILDIQNMNKIFAKRMFGVEL